MALRFILGNSGSGKTDTVYRQVVEEAQQTITKNFLILVPEQFTMQTQQKLVELAPGHAIMNIDVLSFKRLAYRVFDELGMNHLQVLEETGKNLVLRRVAEEKKGQLTVMAPNMSRMGYIDEVKSLISELVQYNITPDRLEEYSRSATLPPAFRAKLADLVTIYRGFGDFMKDRYITAEEILSLLTAVAEKSALLKDSVIVLDEFTGFTPIQNRLLQKLLPMCRRMDVILTIDSRRKAEEAMPVHDLFYLTGKTYRQLKRMAEESGVELLPSLVQGDSAGRRFADAPDLAFLEQQLFRPWFQVMHGKPEHIHLDARTNPGEELLGAVREIRRLVQEEGYRYRDIAVVTGALDTYAPYVEDLFTRYEIPYFLDQTTAIVYHPFIESLRAILQVVEEDFSYEAVMRFLRTGFSGIPEEEIDLLDNYLHATGIRGHRKWDKHWAREIRDKELYDPERLEALRSRICSLFTPICEAFAGREHTAGEQIRALYELTVTLGMEEELWRREAELLQEGQQTKAKEYGQLYRMVMELLEKYQSLLGEDPMGISEFSEILDAGLSALSVASIPPGFDSVTIGDIERTRLGFVKVLFFLGVNDGVIPKAGRSGGILSEFEREMLQAADIELAPGSREQAFIQRFYLYRNLTKPSGHIYLSYSRMDSDGKALRPSYLVNVIGRLFPELETEVSQKLDRKLNLSTSRAALDYLTAGETDEAWYALAGYFLREEDGACLPEEAERLLDARYMSYHPDPISKLTAEAVYGKQLTGSVTRLERFAACAYSHFLAYGLGLREREESGFESVDMGNIYHDALEIYSRDLENSEHNWFNVPDEERDERAAAALQEALRRSPNQALFDTAENVYRGRRMEQIFLQTVWALTRQVRAGSFVPTAFEVSFEELEDSGELLRRLDADHNMLLKGRIDRMDLLEEAGRTMVKVIDYKSGSTKFDLLKVYQGRSLQLVLYLDTAMNYLEETRPKQEIVPAAIFYYNIGDPEVKEEAGEAMTEEQQKEAILAALRPDGLANEAEEVYRGMDGDFSGKSAVIPVTLLKSGALSARGSHVISSEGFDTIRSFVEHQLVQAGRRIYEGEVTVNPYRGKDGDSCAYCPYSSVCGVNARIPGYPTRKSQKLGQEEILERMDTENALFRYENSKE